jgi:hypothetical protein
MVRTFTGVVRDISRQLLGHCSEVARMIHQMLRGLRRRLPSHLRTIAPTLVQTLARTFIGVL